jgi:hypothetical protein
MVSFKIAYVSFLILLLPAFEDTQGFHAMLVPHCNTPAYSHMNIPLNISIFLSCQHWGLLGDITIVSHSLELQETSSC